MKRTFLDRKYKLLEDLAESDAASIVDEENSADKVSQWLSRTHIDGREEDNDAQDNMKQQLDPVVKTAVGPELFQLRKIVDRQSATDPTFHAKHQSTPKNNLQPVISNNRLPNSHSIHPSMFAMNEISQSQLAARQALPKDLPTFSGNPEEWPIFLSTFTQTTQLCRYSDEENIVRLQKCLKGKAYDAVKCRLLHPHNVSGIISTLKMLFGRPETIVHSLIEKTTAMPLPRMDKLETLIDFALGVENLCATIEACGLLDYMCNPYLLRQLVEKLPPAIRLDWARHQLALTSVTVKDFSTWTYHIAEAASSVTQPNIVENKIQKGRMNQKGNIFLHAYSGIDQDKQESSNITVDEPDGEHNTPKCLICRGKCLSANKCNYFHGLSINSRWNAIREHHICRNCLGFNHDYCRSRRRCGKNGCMARHHELLHNDRVVQPETTIHSGSDRAGCHTHRSEANMLFRIVPVIIYGPNAKVETFAFLDDGSSLTLLERSLVDELNIKGNHRPLWLEWTAGMCREEYESITIDFEISSINEPENRYLVRNARTVHDLKLPSQSLSVPELAQRYHHLRGLPMTSYTGAQPRILIGVDNVRLSHTRKGREGKLNEPIASKTKLGWTIYGPSELPGTANGYNYQSFHSCFSSQEHDTMLHQEIKNYFSLDSMGICKPENILKSSDDRRAESLLRSLTRYKDCRYETGLLWKFDNVKLPDSKSIAIRRLQCLEKRMSKDIDLANTLNQKIQVYLDAGYIRKLTTEELQQSHSRVWYLPIFPVINMNKPGKIRLVWDAAAATHGVSLNTCLLTGPDQLIPLPVILYKFREHRIGLSGDIKEMFHQIRINDADQQCQRFLWRHGDPSIEPDIYVMQVMTFGARCSPSTAQYIKNTNAERFMEQYPAAVEAIVKLHYVDDLLLSVDTEEEAIKLAKEVRFVHSQGGFEIRNWVSNSPVVLSQLKHNSIENKCLDLTTELASEKVLGMWWCTKSDCFTFKFNRSRHDVSLMDGSRIPTKREVLKILMCIFDPLGLIAHYLMNLKILLQEIWRSNINWDEVILPEQNQRWIHWLKLLPLVEELNIPRCYRLVTTTRIENKAQLHVLVDASETGFAAVIYLRFEEFEHVECSIVGAKSRVAPLKYLSVPRLELQAALTGARLAHCITNSLSIKISQRFFWSDSRDVLCWLRSDHRRYSAFVAFRVSEILELTEIHEWRWIPTKQNVADLGTKWQKNIELDAQSKWFRGPDFLWKTENNWPRERITGETQIELRPHLLLIHSAVQEVTLDISKFSNWKKLVRIISFLFRFIHNVRMVKARMSKLIGNLTKHEIINSEHYLFRIAQSSTFADEIALLKNAEIRGITCVLPRSSKIYQLSPILDPNGVLRMRGRIEACEFVDADAKNPIILPRKHQVTQLIVQCYHERYNHRNYETVINELRQRFNIPQLRTVLNEIKRRCQRCKNERAVPQPPAMGDLPQARLAAFTRPFSYIGIDYFGPMSVSVGRRVEKRWGVLFTCLTIRAVHIEIAHTLNTSSCIMAIKNFIARRGSPITIYSDRGTNFIGASRELKEALNNINNTQLATGFVNSNTEWIFNPPASPHMGGCWERMIRTVKQNMKQVLTDRMPSDEVLRNVLVEIENVINSRPLTHVPIDSETSSVLTPNHFLIGSSNGTKPDAACDSSGTMLKQSWLISQKVANAFWKRWIRDYLPYITRRSKWFYPVKPIEIDDIVVIVDNNLPRNTWPKGRIIAVQPGKDGQVRSATIQTSTGIYDRPAVKLAVLDVRHEETSKPPSTIRPTPGGTVGNTA